jgi:hypothetical protein
MGITENASYLKGFADGIGIDESTKEGKVIIKLLTLVNEMAEKIDILEKQNEELYSYIEEIDEDLGNLEEDYFDELNGEEDYSDLNDGEEYDPEDDEDYYEIECPSCGEKICFTDDVGIEELVCPACGELVGDTEIVGCDGDCDSCDGCE